MKYSLAFMVLCMTVKVNTLNLDIVDNLVGDVFDVWEEFKSLFSKIFFSPDEERRCFKNFKHNFKRIKKHNKVYHAGHVPYKLDLNEFADRNQIDLVNELCGDTPELETIKRKGTALNYTASPYINDLPDSFDWIDRGAVNQIESQGKCGSCWSFAAAGVLEGQYAIKYGKRAVFSKQNLLDCSSIPEYGNNGCDGGSARTAYLMIKEMGGVNLALTYPYTGGKDSCKYNASNPTVSFPEYFQIFDYNERLIQDALVNGRGPISITIYADWDFFFYRGGIYRNSDCKPKYKDVNHAVLLVGYGVTPEGQKYWKLKNTWGESWGEKGYMRIAFGENMCGLAYDASFAQIGEALNFIP